MAWQGAAKQAALSMSRGILLRKILNLLALLLIAGAGAAYVFLGPSVFYGGPSKAEIIRVTRAVMVSTAASPAEDAIAKAAILTPQGFCSSNNGTFACLVDVTSDGQPVGSFVSVLTKGPEGWVAAE